MAKASPATDKCINRRAVLKGGTALAAGSALLRGGYAEAQPRANRLTALFAYVGAFDGYSDAGTRCRYQNGAARTRRLRQLGKSSQPIEMKWANLAPVGKIVA